MEFIQNQSPLLETVEELERISAKAGLTGDEVVQLLDSGLEVVDLLNHIRDVLSNRMN